MACLVFCAVMRCLGLCMVVGVYWFAGDCGFVPVNSVDYFGSLFLYISFDFNLMFGSCCLSGYGSIDC